MKKIILLLVLLPMFSFGQNYSMTPVSLSYIDFTNSPGGGGGGSISISNNILTVSLSAGWSPAPMKLGVIKPLNITPIITYLELGPIMYNSIPTGYFAKIDNNNLTFYVTTYPANISGCSLSFTKNFASTITLDKIVFSYDNAGNQINRYLCISCPSTVGKKAAPKEIIALTESDLQKFSTEDVLSYYPNPVKEELYLKWELIADKTVSTIYLYNINGQVLKNYENLGKTNAQNIPFLNYPVGSYLVVLVYSDGEQKTIKIVK
jgi:hypothetical protein